jgi:hypothetical protein
MTLDGRDTEATQPTEERLAKSVGLAQRLLDIGALCAAAPDVGRPQGDESVAYDETGMWR